MSDLQDLPELDDLRIREGGLQDANVRTSGIDLKQLNAGLESNFEIQLNGDEQDDAQQDPETNEQFDKYELFQQLNYECNDTEVCIWTFSYFLFWNLDIFGIAVVSISCPLKFSKNEVVRKEGHLFSKPINFSNFDTIADDSFCSENIKI